MNGCRDKKDLREKFKLYAVTDRTWLGEDTLRSHVERALRGGVTFVQLREKKLSENEFLESALEIKKLCEAYRVPLVINDNVEVALASGADGVHVGQDDMEAADVRAKLGPDKIIGVSAHSVSEALRAQAAGADYLGVGAAFPTGSKDDANVIDHGTIRAICEAVDIPVVAIGGIGADNVLQLAGTGICGVAVISAIFGRPDIESAARNLKKLTEQL